jgi:hypothetical protein
MAATWIINRSFTFGPSDRSLAAEGSRYGAVGLAAALFNYAVYSGLLLIVPGPQPLPRLAGGLRQRHDRQLPRLFQAGFRAPPQKLMCRLK